ncbi:MAG TPA: hypothetical protein VN581_00435 [Patescibacteria group bacterium]|nr:hypothetical protein [Patescibacteria group bacterium]
MTKFAKAVGAWITALALASCGGGGGSGDGGGFTAPGFNVSVAPALSQTTPFSLVDVPVRVTSSNGSPASNGTQVTLQVSSASVGVVSSLQRVGSGAVIGERITATTSGGTALFRFHSRGVGSVTLTATAADTSAGSAQVSASATIAVVAGPSTDPRLKMTPTTTNLPANSFAVGPFYGSPYIADVTLEWRRLDGSLANDGSVLGVSATPFIDTVNGYSTPDDGSTPANEFEMIMNTGSVKTTGGRATIFVHSAQRLSTFSVQITGTDPDTQETLSQSLTFNVIQGSPRLPATVSLVRGGRHVYASNSGGNTTDQISARILDGNGLEVPDAGTTGAPANNVQIEIVGGAQGGERLQAVAANGSSASGGTVNTRSVQGIANLSYQAGTRVGTFQIKATADRADNNVDNGISDPVSGTTSVTVGDGRLFDLDITTPTSESISEIVFSDGVTDQNTGNYVFNVSALATDRYGNPVIPGTEIRFGSIDGPQSGGDFAIHGGDGDPQEGGTGFNAPTGAFKTAGGGAGPNDTLIVFGEESNGNRDLESARRIASVPNNTNLTVTQRFNHNDDTGATVNNGPVLPYVIGRAEDANVTPAAFTDQFGVAFAQIAFPAVKIGKLAALYAQGNGDIVNGAPELVTDAEYLRLPGIAPGSIIASPNPIAGNTTVDVEVCLTDATGQGVANVRIPFTFENLFGSGSVDNVANQGLLANLTGSDGCANAVVRTSGLPQSEDQQASVKFGWGDLTDSVDIRVNNNWHLYAFPSRTSGDGARLFTLRLVDSSGNRVPGVLIVGTCEATSPQFLNISTHPGNTNAQGETTTIVDADGFDVAGGAGGGGGGGEDAGCTFRTINNEASVDIVWGVRDICDLFSPTPPSGCDAATLTVTMPGTGSVMSTNPTAALQCIGPGTCVASFNPLENVTLSASANATWTDACSTCGAGVQTCTVALGATGSNTQCTVTIP